MLKLPVPEVDHNLDGLFDEEAAESVKVPEAQKASAAGPASAVGGVVTAIEILCDAEQL